MPFIDHTYWNHNGRHQQAADALDEHVPARGEATANSPIELFRVASNAYHDLYNNGLGNAEIRLPPFLAEIQRVIAKGLLPGHDTPAIKDAVKDVADLLADYQETVDEDEDDYEESPYPDAGHLDEPMEILMDAVIQYASQAEDPTKPDPALAA